MGKCINVSWNRKAIGESDMGFDEEYVHSLCNVNHVSVNSEQYNKILNTLDDLPVKVLSKVKRVSVKDWGTALAVIIKSKGKKPLVIDTQGFNYPRYKSWIKPK